MRRSDEWTCLMPPFKEKPITNADHIRSMSDEELAAEIVLLHTTCEVCAKNEMCGEMLGIAACVEGVKDWLKQPYEGAAE